MKHINDKIKQAIMARRILLSKNRETFCPFPNQLAVSTHLCLGKLLPAVKQSTATIFSSFLIRWEWLSYQLDTLYT